MECQTPSSFSRFFDNLSCRVTKVTGSPGAFIAALMVTIVWGISGPFFHFSETWQLVINTGTTIITFLMVFVIQQAQNKDTVAIHLKLNEIIASIKTASNRMIDVEDLTADELDAVKKYYVKLSELAEKEKGIQKTHSIEEAARNNDIKLHADKKD